LRDLFEIGDVLRRGEISPVELTQACLERIEKLNPLVNAFVTVTGEEARAKARLAEEEIRSGNWRGPLHGIPYGLKDLIDTAGIPTTAASTFYKYRVTMQNARVVEKLDQAGAILLGKQNLHEFAYGGSGLIGAFGVTRNPWDVGKITGGSSGGSAAATALHMGYFAIGTDTAGSVREPAALCGVVGLKPTYGRVSLNGIIPLSPSLDHVGPIARNVADAAIVLGVISDTASREACEPLGTMKPLPSDWQAEIRKSCRELRIGVPRKFFFEDLNPEVAESVEAAIDTLRSLVKEVRDIELCPDTDRTLQKAESYAVHQQDVRDSEDLYQAETVRRIRAGESITPAELTASRAALLKQRLEVQQAFEEIDLLITPTMPIPAPSIDALREHPEALRPQELVLLRNTRPFNVWGLPAISVPCGFTSDGLPIGLQIAGPHWCEDRVLRLALTYEQATAWHKRRPALLSDMTT
jgi:aspartyl-tRNA(Asn)/glutamyl-tRNA(Gln) amidotransferase subunit A